MINRKGPMLGRRELTAGALATPYRSASVYNRLEGTSEPLHRRDQ